VSEEPLFNHTRTSQNLSNYAERRSTSQDVTVSRPHRQNIFAQAVMPTMLEQ
jgi:hypothetical protein